MLSIRKEKLLKVKARFGTEHTLDGQIVGSAWGYANIPMLATI
jgi:hypothetical protein